MPSAPPRVSSAGWKRNRTLLGRSLIFEIPGGNRVEIVGYDNVQCTKAPNVLRGMGLTHLAKNEKAKKELAEKGMALE